MQKSDSAVRENVSPLRLMANYFREFKVLRQTPREYWGIQIINFLDCAAYFSLLTVITLFLSEQIGVNDTNTGYIVTVFTSVTTIILLVSGLLTDSIGIRKSLIFAMVSRGLATVAIVVLAAMPDFPLRVALVTLCLILMAPSMAMMQTIYQSANARYTNAQSRSAGFNLWYLFMNLGATLSGFLVDIVRLSLGLSNTWIIGAGVISSVLGLLVMLTMIRTEAQFGDDGQFHKELSAKAQADQDSRKQKGPWNIFKELVSETAFWRFIALLSLLLGVRAVFVYVYLLMPKYWTRIMGEDAAIGTLNTINPILIVVGLVLFIPLSNKFNIFKMLVFGAIISSLSLFVLVLPWQATANILGTLGQTLHLGFLKNDFVAAYYALSILSQVLLSLGEVIWSPKLQEYTAAIAPEGQEGSYFGLSSIPWFLAKTVVSLMSGHMLSRWVPEGIGPRLRAGTVAFWDSPEAMWLILGLIALVGPLLALLFKNFLTKGARWQHGS